MGKNSSTITIASALILKALEGARAQGYDIASILERCDVSPKILNEAKSRVPLHQFVRLVRYVVDIMDDEAGGLLEKPQRKGYSKLISYGVISAKTVGEALHRTVEYYNLFENGLIYELREQDNVIIFQAKRRFPAAVKNSFIIEIIMLQIHRFHSWLANSRIPLQAITLDSPTPKYANELKFLFYGAPVLFNQEVNSLVFDRDAMDLPIRQSNTTLETFLKRAPLDLFAPLDTADNLTLRIRYWIESKLKESCSLPELNEACEHFGVKPQTLRRWLNKEGTVYQEIKSDVRRDLAIYLLNTNKHSVEEIAYKVGFSEPSSFIRAFKAWTGLTPRAYQKF